MSSVIPDVDFLIRANGNIFVVTNAHIILISNLTDVYDRITVEITFSEKRTQVFDACIVGVDARSDLAVLSLPKLKETKGCTVTTLSFADSSLEKAGNPCFVVGNPLTVDRQSVASGVIREPQFAGPVDLFIQEQVTTDITTFYGNSGGPLFNEKGQVIAITSFAYNASRSGGYTAGLGGGCSSRMMVPILQNIIKGHRMTPVPLTQNTLYPLGNTRRTRHVLSYRKATFGDVTWALLTSTVAVSLYPTNYKKLNMQGLVITAITSPDNVLDRPVSGQPIRPGDIITPIQDKSREWLPIGAFPGQYAAGVVLWQYDPNECPIVPVKVIHNPQFNTTESISKLRFDINYPRTEAAPYQIGQLSSWWENAVGSVVSFFAPPAVAAVVQTPVIPVQQ